ncbi:hypothetical protein Q0590_36725 [Rhodocytophaga aerolata]|uniref:Uncharacterized protein n=1 Tax=Rhodocytophaga aerolata TaxID=455078 RepID=A0ABT8RLC3_9BACT|nr:hypothetical protein [Rhodocytophaga aerolata]MDO1451872.1 hypothetical protein [Rhodocytophaga aerolata]
MPFEELMKKPYIIFLILLFACTSKQANETDCNEINQIVITDKFSETSANKKTQFTDSTTLSFFCQEIKRLQPVTKEPIVKVNFGYYMLDIVYKDGVEVQIEIIYTKFDGVVIRLDGKYYKNDELDSVMRGYLAPKEWQG